MWVIVGSNAPTPVGALSQSGGLAFMTGTPGPVPGRRDRGPDPRAGPEPHGAHDADPREGRRRPVGVGRSPALPLPSAFARRACQRENEASDNSSGPRDGTLRVRNRGRGARFEAPFAGWHAGRATGPGESRRQERPRVSRPRPPRSPSDRRPRPGRGRARRRRPRGARRPSCRPSGSGRLPAETVTGCPPTGPRAAIPSRTRRATSGPGRAGRDDDELVAAVACDGVDQADRLGQHGRDRTQDVVAGLVAVLGVHRPEVVDVEDRDRDLAALPSGSGELELEDPGERPLVGQAGQRIGVGHPLEPLGALGDHRRQAGPVDGDGAERREGIEQDRLRRRIRRAARPRPPPARRAAARRRPARRAAGGRRPRPRRRRPRTRRSVANVATRSRATAPTASPSASSASSTADRWAASRPIVTASWRPDRSGSWRYTAPTGASTALPAIVSSRPSPVSRSSVPARAAATSARMGVGLWDSVPASCVTVHPWRSDVGAAPAVAGPVGNHDRSPGGRMDKSNRPPAVGLAVPAASPDRPAGGASSPILPP